MMRYNPKKIEAKWQKKWLAEKIYEPEFKHAKKPFYNLMMFPYPSAEGLHIGGMRTFTGVDIYGRFKRMQGHDVFEPIGLDAFGIHSENYALKTGRHPMAQARILEKKFYTQLAMMGNGFAWDERLATNDPEYYRWTQWIFVEMFRHGLAYRKKQAVNWCPSCKTVLADEQVVAGKCERCGTIVIKKELEQWFFKITDYAERLLKNLETLDWSERVKIAQKNWIGKSEGAELEFGIKNSESRIKVFTTRPDTLFGATYLVLAPEHPLITNQESRITNRGEVQAYVKKAKGKAEAERMAEEKEKTGVELQGIKAINPANQEEIPIFVADYVLGGYGTGAIMAVPAHDERDYDFAKKFKLPVRTVVAPPDLNCVIVHGCPGKKEDGINIQNRTEKQHWIQWMRSELETSGFRVHAPSMPEPWQPIYDVWKKEFEKMPVDENTVLVGHSCGAAFLVRWLGETQRKVKKLILVAGAKIPGDNSSQFIREFYDFEIDKNIRRNLEEVVIFVSDNEEERHRRSARLYSDGLGARVIEMQGKGHFMFQDMGTYEFPELFEEILSSIESYIGGGTIVQSASFSSLESEVAKWKIANSVHGKRVVQYHLRDWLISRQRYWGPPIPMIFCEACHAKNKGERRDMPGWYAVLESDLPVELPNIKNFRPTGKDQSPLASVGKFYKVRCPGCGAWARRETDVSDTFLDSAWYFLRYPGVANKKAAWDSATTKKWLPVDMYIGGAEHSVLHLLYARFLTMAFADWRLLSFEEPFTHFRAHGLITKDGAKMSKSKGNVVSPDDYIRAFGADAVRMYLAFLAPFEEGGDFRDTGIRGITRFLERVWKMVQATRDKRQETRRESEKLSRAIHRTIKKVGEDIEHLQYNTAISALMILLNEYEAEADALGAGDIKIFLKLLAPLAPHITEELWQAAKSKEFKSIHLEPWPTYDPKLIQEDTFELVIQVNGKVRGRVTMPMGASEDAARASALAIESVKHYLSGTPRKIIFISNKLINFVP